MLSLSSCSNTVGNEKTTKAQTLNKQQKVEFGTVLAVRTVPIKADTNPRAAILRLKLSSNQTPNTR